MTKGLSKSRYDSPEQYAEAFQQMIDALERIRDIARSGRVVMMRHC